MFFIDKIFGGGQYFFLYFAIKGPQLFFKQYLLYNGPRSPINIDRSLKGARCSGRLCQVWTNDTFILMYLYIVLIKQIIIKLKIYLAVRFMELLI